MKKVLIAASFVSLIFSCKSGGDAKKQDSTNVDSIANDKTKTVEIVVLSPKTFNSYIDIQGKVDADESVAINAEMPGTVSKVGVHLGDEVSAGQILAELDAKVIQQGIAELQIALELSNTIFEKQKNLWDQKIGTEVQFLSAKSQKESLDKKMSALQQQLEMSRIKSPIKGMVDAIDIKIGQATMPGLPAIRVVNMCSLKVKGEVSESYMAKIKKGNDVKILFPDLQDSINSKITYAAKMISPLNRTFSITIDLDCVKELHPNMIAILKIIDYSNSKAFVVPVSTIQKAEEGDFVFVADGKMAKKVRVKVGRMYNGSAEIIEGLSEGNKLITKGFQELNDGEQIKF